MSILLACALSYGLARDHFGNDLLPLAIGSMGATAVSTVPFFQRTQTTKGLWIRAPGFAVRYSHVTTLDAPECNRGASNFRHHWNLCTLPLFPPSIGSEELTCPPHPDLLSLFPQLQLLGNVQRRQCWHRFLLPSDAGRGSTIRVALFSRHASHKDTSPSRYAFRLSSRLQRLSSQSGIKFFFFWHRRSDRPHRFHPTQRDPNSLQLPPSRPCKRRDSDSMGRSDR